MRSVMLIAFLVRLPATRQAPLTQGLISSVTPFTGLLLPNHSIFSIQFTVFKCLLKNVCETGFCLHLGFL